jgi:UDP-N-acetylmuramate--alanine ligase
MSDLASGPFFFCGIGGSGMLPLALILKGLGYEVYGSDRSRDQGRLPHKFAWIESQGISLYPQDGSGVTPEIGTLVVSTAVEDSIPDVAAAKANKVTIRKRAEMLAQYFNQSRTRIAIAGTSGKTTTTGMIGYLLKEAGLDPVVMNGGIFRNYAYDNPYATALVGKGDVFVTEADESDGSIALYHPDIAVLHNITLDHKPLEELQALFSDFIGKAQTAVINTADKRVLELARNYKGRLITYHIDSEADVRASDVKLSPEGLSAQITIGNDTAKLTLELPGLHNLSNALAALGVAHSLGIELHRSVEILARFEGIKRRMEKVGTKNGITVFDDFAHNPDKVAATLAALKSFPGRLLIFFQPHGYGFLKLVKDELAQTFASYMTESDQLYLIEPLYMGGTVDRSIGSSHLAEAIAEKGCQVTLCDTRDDVVRKLLETRESGDRVIVMGARDDTLSDVATKIFQSL